MENILYATFKEGQGDVVYTKTTYQHNRGVKLRISGVALPEKYQVHFSNDENFGVATALWVSGSDVSIPDAYFETGNYVHVWIAFAEDGKYANVQSMYKVVIPVEKRPAILQVDGSGGLVINAHMSDTEDHMLVFG